MKPYYFIILFILLTTDIILLIKLKQVKKDNLDVLTQIITLQDQKQKLGNNIRKYYSKRDINIYDFDLQKYISEKTSDDQGLFFRFLNNACDPCINEQIEILNKEFDKFKRKGISVSILIDDSLNRKKGIQFIPELREKIFYVNRCLLDKMIEDETSYYFWIEDGVASNIFYPVPGIKSTTLSYFSFITKSKDDKFFY